MKFSLPWPISRAMLVSTLLVVGTFLLIDFLLRIFVGLRADERPYDAPRIVPVPSAYDSEVAFGRLESWVPKPVLIKDEARERSLGLGGQGDRSRAMGP